MAASGYNVLVGTETGLLKGKAGNLFEEVTGINVEKKNWANLNSVGEVSREKEITAMCWDKDQSQICLGLRNRKVTIYDSQTGGITQEIDCPGGEGPFKGLAVWNNSFITCVESGLLKVWKEDDSVEIDVGQNIHRMRQHPEEFHLVATGGKENELNLWDLENPAEPIFKAKNVRHDWLELRVPIWVTDMAFLPGSHKVVTCTGHHQVRLYDPSSSQRRPVLNMEFDEYPLTAMGLRPGGNQVLVGNTHGKMALVDIRKAGKVVHQFKGFAGSISCIQCHSGGDLVASCGLDRHLRIHDIDQKHLLHKFYLKSRLNCLLFADELVTASSKQGSQRASDRDTEEVSGEADSSGQDEASEDELWEHMPVVKTQVIKRSNEDQKEATKKQKKDNNQNIEVQDGTTATKKKNRSKRSKRKSAT